MIKSIKHNGWDDESGAHKYILTDSDFVTDAAGIGGLPEILDEMLVVIKEYKKRNLNVAANLAIWYKTLARRFFGEKSTFESLINALQYWEHRTKAVNGIKEKYLEDVKKYLILM